MAHCGAARTNLSSSSATVDYNDILGEGAFRIVYSGTYVGGRRNQQEAACKSFKYQYQNLESEYYQFDFKIADRAIQYAEIWNGFCDRNRAIQISRGTVLDFGGHKLLVEPLITPYVKFTSNNGWISDDIAGLAMEAFTHFTYHQSGGSLIVCDLQGRWRKKSGPGRPRRYELSDPAICSRSRSYGPTDLGEKGIDSFFCNHSCNDFCYRHGGGRWARPRNPRRWFVQSSSTSMISSTEANMLTVTNTARFTLTLQPYYEDDSDSDY